MVILCLFMDDWPPETGVYEWKKFSAEGKQKWRRNKVCAVQGQSMAKIRLNFVLLLEWSREFFFPKLWGGFSFHFSSLLKHSNSIPK